MMATKDPRTTQRRGTKRVDLVVVQSTLQPHRPSIRTLDQRTIRTGLERAQFKVGDTVSLIPTAKLNQLLKARKEG